MSIFITLFTTYAGTLEAAIFAILKEHILHGIESKHNDDEQYTEHLNIIEIDLYTYQLNNLAYL